MTVRACVCAITLARPEGLERMLRSVLAQRQGDDAFELCVCVVENDAGGEMRELVQRVAGELGVPAERIAFGTEARRGIPFARNAAVGLARERFDPDVYCFIDDDETAEPDWLAKLLRVRRETDADAVAGRAEPKFMDPDVPPWVIEGGFFDLPRYKTGERLASAYTNNILFSRSIVDELAPLFDTSLGMTGADDSHAFMRIVRAGFVIVWADEAVTWEWTPASRSNAKWILQRGYRVGNAAALLAVDFDGRLRGGGVFFAIGLYRIVKGIVFLILLGAFGKRFRVLYARHICYGCGAIVGVFGKQYGEYRRIHGS